MAVWALTGIWHGASWNFIFWGLGYFAVIALEKAAGLPARLKGKAGRMAYRALALLFVNFQWVLFRVEGLRAGIRYIKNMLGASSNAAADARAAFLLRDNLAFILAAAILCFPAIPWAEKRLSQAGISRMAWDIMFVAVNVVFFLWAVSMVVAGRNNPFAYANF